MYISIYVFIVSISLALAIHVTYDLPQLPPQCVDTSCPQFDRLTRTRPSQTRILCLHRYRHRIRAKIVGRDCRASRGTRQEGRRRNRVKRARWDTVICIAIGFGRDCCAVHGSRDGGSFVWGRGGGEGKGKGRRGFCSERVTLFQPSLPTLVVLAPRASPRLDIQIVADLQHCHFQILHLLLEESQSNHMSKARSMQRAWVLFYSIKSRMCSWR